VGEVGGVREEGWDVKRVKGLVFKCDLVGAKPKKVQALPYLISDEGRLVRSPSLWGKKFPMLSYHCTTTSSVYARIESLRGQ
jgi:hypothetical protein